MVFLTSNTPRCPCDNGSMRSLIVALLLISSAFPAAQEKPLPDFDTFAAQVKTHLATDEERQSGYMFLERRTEQKLDGSSRVTAETVKVFEVYPGLPGKASYRRLIEEDGRRVASDKLAKEDRDRQQEIDSYLKSQTSESRRQKAARE